MQCARVRANNRRNDIMRKRLAKGILTALLIAILATTLSACSLFDDIFGGDNTLKPKVTSVLTIYEGGLEEGEDGYIATVGQEFSLSAKLNIGAPDQADYKWYMLVDGQKTQIGNEKTLRYTFDNYTEKTYQFFATADGVQSTNKVTIRLAYATTLVDTAISSTSHLIHDGIIQQSINEITTVRLHAEWNQNAMPEGAEVSVAWSVGDNPTVESTDLDFEYTPIGVGTYEIHLTLTYGEDVVKHSVKILVIEGFSAVSTASLILEEGGIPFGSGVETQYYQEVSSEHRSEITVSLSTTPIGETDYESPVKWIVRDRDGERVLEDTSRQVTFEPAYGETIIKAVVDNVATKHLVLFAFTDGDYQYNKKYMENVYVWEDGVENAYITDQTDTNRFIKYVVSTRQLSETDSTGAIVNPKPFEFNTASNFDFVESGSQTELDIALRAIDESGLVSVRTGWKYNQVSGEMFDYMLYMTDNSRLMNPQSNYSPATEVTQDETAIVNFKKLEDSQKRTMLPIDDNPQYTTPITNSQMLYRVLGWGYRPLFDSSAESQKMQALYDSIRQVALDYITDEMSEYEKTLIIYEWIAQKVDYDYAVVEANFTNYESLDFNAFSLEGVFSNADGEGYGQAVCDGRAKAFVALCGVEDITAVRVTGNSKIDGVEERHAWNKVLIDINGDGKREWFMCDTTWSDRSSASDRTERLNKQYFLVTDSYIANTHFADDSSYNPVCNTKFDYYANTIIENGDNDFDLFIDKKDSILGGSDELDRAVNYAESNGIMLEIKVSTSVCDTANELKLLILKYTYNSSVDIYTIASASNYNIYTIVFN